jgi:sialate O-acetylesterase
MLLHFTHAEGGILLESPGRGAFKIAGSDHMWFPAEAHLVNGVVVVSTSLVQEPVAARYDWSRSAEAALLNSAGLPAKPFRTDFPSSAQLSISHCCSRTIPSRRAADEARARRPV